MNRLSVPIVVVVCGLTLAACGSGGDKVKLSRGVIQIGPRVQEAALVTSVLGIERGTRASVVLSQLGQPWVRVRAGRLTCWDYHARQPQSAVDGFSFS